MIANLIGARWERPEAETLPVYNVELHPAVAMDPDPGRPAELGVWRRRARMTHRCDHRAEDRNAYQG